MASFKLPYGTNYEDLLLPDSYRVDVIAPARFSGVSDPNAEIINAINYPVGGVDLEQFASARSVAIAINDKTRPVPHHLLLPPLLKKLSQIGIPNEAITFFIATGSHVPMPESEFLRILPEDIAHNYLVISHDIEAVENFEDIGVTRYGTVVQVNRLYHQCDLRIVVGNVEPHHFAGYSGGVKSAAIGLTSRKTINHNHAMLVDPLARIGEFDFNPLRQDIEEIGKIIGIHFALNVVMNDEKQIVKAFFGQPDAVMNASIPVARAICQTDVRGDYDVVIASAGGYPKDINLYQAQKALTHGALIVKNGGVIILVAACDEGPGNMAYEQFMVGMKTYEDVIAKFKKVEFRVGQHKAFQIAREGIRTKIYLVSKMSSDTVSGLLLNPANSLQQAWNNNQKQLSENIRIAIMPRATNTIPILTR